MLGSFEQQKNRKAFFYTIGICGLLLLLSFIISWKIMPPAKPVAMDLIEINLGNYMEGFGEEQPLIKGEMSPAATAIDGGEPAPAQPAVSSEEPEQPANSFEDNTKDESVNIPKPEKQLTAPKVSTVQKVTSPKPSVKNTTTSPNTTVRSSNNATIKAAVPQKPRLTYNGPGNGSGNNADQDNGYRSQGNNPSGTGDIGSPTGNKDSYGNTPGGRVGGPKVISGNRKVIRYYSFTGDLPKATIYASVNVNPDGRGTLIKLVQPSTSYSNAYANAIRNYLSKMQFDKSPQSSTVTVQFNFTVN